MPSDGEATARFRVVQMPRIAAEIALLTYRRENAAIRRLTVAPYRYSRTAQRRENANIAAIRRRYANEPRRRGESAAGDGCDAALLAVINGAGKRRKKPQERMSHEYLKSDCRQRHAVSCGEEYDYQ